MIVVSRITLAVIAPGLPRKRRMNLVLLSKLIYIPAETELLCRVD